MSQEKDFIGERHGLTNVRAEHHMEIVVLCLLGRYTLLSQTFRFPSMDAVFFLNGVFLRVSMLIHTSSSMSVQIT